jgi:hypothetical protein
MRLLHVLGSVDPRGGGPMEGVRQRGIRLKELGHAVGPVSGSYGYTAALTPWLETHAAG